MKVFLFFGMMIVALVTSLYYGRVQYMRSKNLWISLVLANLLNLFILGAASIWWYLTETDGISRGLGVVFYATAFGIIGIILFVYLLFLIDRRS